MSFRKDPSDRDNAVDTEDPPSDVSISLGSFGPKKPNAQLLAARQEYQNKKKIQRSARNIAKPSGTSETDALVGTNTSPHRNNGTDTQGWCSWATTKIANAASYVYHHPVDTLTAVGGNVASVLSSAPFVILSFLNPTGKEAKDFTTEVWNSLPESVKAHAATNALSSLALNAILMYYFSGNTLAELKKSKDRMRNEDGTLNAKEICICTAAITFGVGSAFAAFGLGYSNWLWLPLAGAGQVIAAGSLTAPSMGMSLFSRFLGTQGPLKRGCHFSLPCYRPQRTATLDFIGDLNRIDNNHKEELEKKFEALIATVFCGKESHEYDITLSAQELDEITEALAELLMTLINKHPHLIQNKECADTFREILNGLVDYGFALMVGLAVFPIYEQYGLNGINFFTKLGGFDLHTLNFWYQRLIGFIPAAATTMLYMATAFDMRNFAYRVMHHLWEHPEDLPKAIPLIVATGLSASGAEGAARNAINHPNMIWITPHSHLSDTVIQLNGTGAANVNILYALNATLFSKDRALTPANIALPDIVRRLNNTQNLVSPHIANKFKLFSDKVKENRYENGFGAEATNGHSVTHRNGSQKR